MKISADTPAQMALRQKCPAGLRIADAGRRPRYQPRQGAKKPAIIMARKSLLRDFGCDLAFQAGDAYVFSNWSGYLDAHDPAAGWAMAVAAGAKTQHLHTSGHALTQALSDFAAAIAPAALVPGHGNKWDEPGIALPPVQRLDDGQPWQVP